MRKRMLKALKRGFAFGLAALVLAGSIRLPLYAKETDASFVKTGSYQYSSNENRNIQDEDVFTYRDDCFMRSSFPGCTHLTTLSAQLAISSACYFGPDEDKYGKDVSDTEFNTKNLLTDMGFENVEDNAYCHIERLPNSGGVVVASKPVKAYGKDYTLLAIVPTSAGYKQEWSGNFNVGTGDVHAGFKAARDEDLRFVKQYINNHNITGNLKVWIAGHSRGSAVSNLLGGFFAGGGIEYFGGKVSITPEDVYCYAFATPKTVKNGASKKEVFSVSGNRDGEYAAYDTPGEAWDYPGDGAIDIRDECYNGVRNFPFDYDFVTYLPPQSWGFDYFGQVLDLRKTPNPVTEEAMMVELKDLNNYTYEDFVKGDYRNYKDVTLNPAEVLNISIDEDSDTDALDQIRKNESLFVGEVKGEAGYARVISERLQALTHIAPTNEAFATGGAQELLSSVAAVVGMLIIQEQYSDDIMDDPGYLLKPALLSYLVYASDSLQEEGKADSEGEAAAIALLELVDWLALNGIGAHDVDSLTVDEFIVMTAHYVADHKDTPLIQMVREKLNEMPVDTETRSGQMLALFRVLLLARYLKDNQAPLGDALFGALNAFVNGAEEDSAFMIEFTDNHPGEEPTPQDARYDFYYYLQMIFTTFVPLDDVSFLGDGDGSGLYKDMIIQLLPFLTMDSEMTKHSLTEAADTALSDAITEMENKAFAAIDGKAGNPHGDAFNQAVHGHFAVMRANVPMLRGLLLDLLFYNPDGTGFSTAYNIHNLASLLYNLDIFKPAHYNELFIAWARAQEKAADDEHYIELVPAGEATCTEAGNKEYWLYHDSTQEKYYDTSVLSKEYTEEEITVAAKGHTPGAVVIENEVDSTETEEGHYDEVKYCTVCKEETSRTRVVIPKKESDDKSEEKSGGNDSSPKTPYLIPEESRVTVGGKPATVPEPQKNTIVNGKDSEKETPKDSTKKDDSKKDETGKDDSKKEDAKKDTSKEEIKDGSTKEDSESKPFEVIDPPVQPDDKAGITDRKFALPYAAWIGIIGGVGVISIGLIIFLILKGRK